MHLLAILFISCLLSSITELKSKIHKVDEPDRDENIWMPYYYDEDLELLAQWQEFKNRTESELELGKTGFIEEITLWNHRTKRLATHKIKFLSLKHALKIKEEVLRKYHRLNSVINLVDRRYSVRNVALGGSTTMAIGALASLFFLRHLFKNSLRVPDMSLASKSMVACTTITSAVLFSIVATPIALYGYRVHKELLHGYENYARSSIECRYLTQVIDRLNARILELDPQAKIIDIEDEPNVLYGHEEDDDDD